MTRQVEPFQAHHVQSWGDCAPNLRVAFPREVSMGFVEPHHHTCGFV